MIFIVRWRRTEHHHLLTMRTITFLALRYFSLRVLSQRDSVFTITNMHSPEIGYNDDE